MALTEAGRVLVDMVGRDIGMGTGLEVHKADRLIDVHALDFRSGSFDV